MSKDSEQAVVQYVVRGGEDEYECPFTCTIDPQQRPTKKHLWATRYADDNLRLHKIVGLKSFQCCASAADGRRCPTRVCIGLPYCPQHTREHYGVKYTVDASLSSPDEEDVRGLCAQRRMEGGEVLPYSGDALTDEGLTERYGTDKRDLAPYTLQVRRRPPLYVDAGGCRWIGALVNHSDDPNCVLETKSCRKNCRCGLLYTSAWVRLLRDVEVGEFLSVDYGDTYWMSDKNCTHVTK
jgi:hypothetical protein